MFRGLKIPCQKRLLECERRRHLQSLKNEGPIFNSNTIVLDIITELISGDPGQPGPSSFLFLPLAPSGIRRGCRLHLNRRVQYFIDRMRFLPRPGHGYGWLFYIHPRSSECTLATGGGVSRAGTCLASRPNRPRPRRRGRPRLRMEGFTKDGRGTNGEKPERASLVPPRK
jgi:hypothetical protein